MPTICVESEAFALTRAVFAFVFAYFGFFMDFCRFQPKTGGGAYSYDISTIYKKYSMNSFYHCFEIPLRVGKKLHRSERVLQI